MAAIALLGAGCFKPVFLKTALKQAGGRLPKESNPQR
jgi:hypothetical protein